jgi:tRNA threonylcarbamoyladenosine biosynthesis protein TsaB
LLGTQIVKRFEWILAVDASLGPCSVAVLRAGEVLAFLEEITPQTQAKRLVLMMEEALAAAGCGYADLDAIISTVGPGTFTGLRIGLAAARGIGFAASKPVFGATTLVTAALAATDAPQAFTVTLNAGKGEVYHQSFTRTPFAASGDAGLSAPEELGGAIINIVRPDARHAGLLAFHHPELLVPAEPVYIRPPDAKLPSVKNA